MNQRLCTPRHACALLIAVVTVAAAACSSQTVTTPGQAENTLALCSDKIDNDNNGLTDCADDSCSGSTDAAIHAYCLKQNADVKVTDSKSDTGSGPETTNDAATDVTGPGDATSTTDASGGCALAGGFNCPCASNGDCDSGYCVDGDQGKVCTKTCTDTCPADWLCKQTDGGMDAAWICVPAYPTLCMPCTQHAECQSNGTTGNYCVPFDYGTKDANGNPLGFIDGSFCMTACTEVTDPNGVVNDTCKAGYSCKELLLIVNGKPVKQCVPDSGQCTCHDAWAQEGKSTECSKTSSAGKCVSQRQCTYNSQTGETVLSLCLAPAPTAEVCGDNIDNDCNGLTDEPGAVNCTNWYQDNDGDGYGTGAPSTANCLCTNPGAGYSNNGGDCNDYNSSIHPGGVEICDNIDNNCNGQTDESGSKGCTFFYHDLDGDGWGNPNDGACLCKSKATSEWILQGGDCDDTPGTGAKIHPGVDEVCDGVDNNCNGQTDEEGAIGCQLYYVDQDNDTYGVTTTGKCLCAASKTNTAGQPGDCDDSNGAINPGAQEICDGIDNDCNGKIDDGAADATCGAIAGGSSKCINGACGVGTCAKGYYDVNGDPSDGCECQSLSNNGNMGTFCGSAIDIGILPDGSATIQKAGQILPGESGDWYTFKAPDTPDTNTGNGGNCDQYAVHIAFALNPGNLFVFDAYRGSCGAADQVCSAETVHDWSTSFYGATPFGPKNKATANGFGSYSPSPVPEAGGECNCVPPNTKFKPCVPTGFATGDPNKPYADPSTDPLLTSCGAPPNNGLPGMNVCSDNSAVYFVKVYTKPGAALTCDQYIIKFDNSSTGAPPPKN